MTTYFPFEDYIYFSNYHDQIECYEENISLVEEMYKKDVKKKNLLLKYVNALTIDHCDEVALEKMKSVLLFFRNIFTKESIIKFINDKMTSEEKILVGSVVFEILVKEKCGYIGEEKSFLVEVVRLKKNISEKYKSTNKWININNIK
jgi:hypothetical protein